MLSMCLLFCFVIFWILCYVMCEKKLKKNKKKLVDNRKKIHKLERLTEKMTDIEDRGRRKNVCLVGLPEGAEGTNAAGFLRVNLSKWIPSLRGRDIEIDRVRSM